MQINVFISKIDQNSNFINFYKFENLVGSGKVVGSLVPATNSHLTHFPVGQIGIRVYMSAFRLWQNLNWMTYIISKLTLRWNQPVL